MSLPTTFDILSARAHRAGRAVAALFDAIGPASAAAPRRAEYPDDASFATARDAWEARVNNLRATCAIAQEEASSARMSALAHLLRDEYGWMTVSPSWRLHKPSTAVRANDLFAHEVIYKWFPALSRLDDERRITLRERISGLAARDEAREVAPSIARLVAEALR
jgi:hypothetical protein